ncbi:MAG: hypothetical protein CMD26_04315 [Flavobacteriales bacterium]|nr:hypothetical protein [Flavobacteriales bacterium]
MRLGLLYIYIFFSITLFSQEFEVVVSDNKVSLSESFEISFVLKNSGKNFTPPPFTEFKIIRGPSKSSSTSIVNGEMSQKISYTYILKPKKVGVFTILPASIKSKGKTIGTRPVTIQVQKNSTDKKQNTPYNIVSRKVHLNVTANKTTCYVGEPIVLTYTLYFNLNIGSVSQNPIQYGDFWVNNIEVDSSTKKQQFKGENYNSAVIKQVVLIPRKSGEQIITPLSLDLIASIPTNRRDFFNMSINQQVDYTAQSKKMSINVLDLPELGRPDNFSGAIGDFSIEVDLDKDSIGVNESSTFTVKVSGSGNLTIVNSPEVQFDSEIEVFEPNNLDNININYRGVRGYKKDEYLIVPRYKGVYNLNPISFNFFNPKIKKYITLNSDAKRITVGGDQVGEKSYTLENVSKEKIDLINEDIKFIKFSNTSFLTQKKFLASIVFYVLIFVGFLIIFLAFLLKKSHLDFYLLFTKNYSKKSLDQLDKLNLLLLSKQYEKLQSELLSILLIYVSSKFSIVKAELSLEKINNILIKKNLSNEIISDFIAQVQYLEKCKYSPHQDDQTNKELIVKARDIINKIEHANDK